MINNDFEFNNMIFHGNGERSAAEVKRLVKLVKYAHMLLCGMQQGPVQDEHEEELRTYVHWIIHSFGYEVEWYDLKHLPYDMRRNNV